MLVNRVINYADVHPTRLYVFQWLPHDNKNTVVGAVYKHKVHEQAGAELCHAQFKLELAILASLLTMRLSAGACLLWLVLQPYALILQTHLRVLHPHMRVMQPHICGCCSHICNIGTRTGKIFNAHHIFSHVYLPSLCLGIMGDLTKTKTDNHKKRVKYARLVKV